MQSYLIFLFLHAVVSCIPLSGLSAGDESALSQQQRCGSCGIGNPGRDHNLARIPAQCAGDDRCGRSLVPEPLPLVVTLTNHVLHTNK